MMGHALASVANLLGRQELKTEKPLLGFSVFCFLVTLRVLRSFFVISFFVRSGQTKN